MLLDLEESTAESTGDARSRTISLHIAIEAIAKAGKNGSGIVVGLTRECLQQLGAQHEIDSEPVHLNQLGGDFYLFQVVPKDGSFCRQLRLDL